MGRFVVSLVAGGLLVFVAVCPAMSFAAPPPNDDFSAAQVLGDSGWSLINTLQAGKEAGEPAHAGNAGGHSVWYRWTAPSSDPVTFDAEAYLGSFNPLLAVYTGTSVDALTEVVSNDDRDETTHSSRVNFVPVTGADYLIAVDGFSGGSGGGWLVWDAPANDFFADAELIAGEAGTVVGSTARATSEAGEPDHGGEPGSPSIWYRWVAPESHKFSFKVLGDDLSSGIVAIYTGTSVDALSEVVALNPPDYFSQVAFEAVAATEYRIAIIDASDGRSPLIRLSWGASPTNDDFAEAEVISGRSGSVSGSNLYGARERGEPWHYVSSGDHFGWASIWYRWTAPRTEHVRFHTAGSRNTAGYPLDTVLAVYTGESLANLTPVAKNGEFPMTEDWNVYHPAAGLSFRARANTAYWIAIAGAWGISGGEGDTVLSWYPGAIIYGDWSPRAEVLIGTAGRDYIRGRGGDDVIFGLAGDDRIFGGNGADCLRGGAGNDLVSGLNGNDVMLGERGADRIIGGKGSDRLFGGTGNDHLVSQDGFTRNDHNYGGRGAGDTVKRDRGDRVYGVP